MPATVAQGVYIARLETGPPGSVVGQEIRMFYWTPDLEQLDRLATTDRNGRFSLRLGDLPIGEIVPFVDIDGVSHEPQPVLRTIRLCATAGSLRRACNEIDLGDLRHDITITVQLR